MFLHFLLQAFLSILDHSPIQQPQQAEAAGVPNDVETISGVDETTGQSFTHTLPVANEGTLGPIRKDDESLGILTSSKSVLVLDRKTSKVLFSKNSDAVRPIASMTKLMTAYTLIKDGIDFNDQMTIQRSDYRAGGTIHLFTGETFSVQDVWMAGLIASDNVAIAALAHHTGLTTEQFADRMNYYAKQLGMDHSSFVEPTGIDSRDVSTAEDLAKLLDADMRIPEIADTVRRPTYSFTPLNKDDVRKVYNTDKLLSSFVNKEPYQIRGGKTGFTYEAGYCLGVVADGPSTADDIIVIALGADSLQDRFLEVKGLIDWTYRHYQW